MKNFNVSRQSPKSSQAWKKEYVYRLQQEYDSLYYYLHYYNPSWKLITKSQDYVGYTPYGSKDVYQTDILNTEGTPSAPTSEGIYRQALAFRWGVKNTTGSPQYINYAEYGTYKKLNPGATLFKIDASDSADWIHYMIFEGALAQYFTQSYSFNYNSSTSKMDVTITNHLINAATKGLSYPIQFTRVPPRYFYQSLSLIPLKYINDGAVVDKIYDNNNRITNDGQTIIQQWGENSDVCMDAVTSYTVNGQTRYEPLFADVILATENESTQQFKAYLDKTQSERKPTEDFFKIIVY